MKISRSTSGAISAFDLDMAEKVHRSLLPKRLQLPGLDVVTKLQTVGRIGGDYATVFPATDGRVYVCVSDVASHGISSALLVTRINSFVRERVPWADRPCQIVQELNSFLCEHFIDLMMPLSFLCGIVDLARMEFCYAGCGHPPALHFNLASPALWKTLDSQQSLLGVFPELSLQCRSHVEPLQRNDRIVLYTDGLIEARNSRGEFFGVDRLAQIGSGGVAENLAGDLLADLVFAEVGEFDKGARRDDSLLMVITLT